MLRALCSAALALAALAAACGPASPDRPAAITPLPPAPPAPPAAPVAAPDGDAHAALRAVICADRSPCEIRRERVAGSTRAGDRLSVATVYAGRKVWDKGGDAAEEPDPRAPIPPDIGLEEAEHTDITSPTIFGGCHRIEYWLVTRRGKEIASAVPVLRLCNDGHGAASVGEDTVTVGLNSMDHTSLGGSAWRWSYRNVFMLSPLRAARNESHAWWNSGPNMESSSWDWSMFAGQTAWYSPPCKADGTPPDLPDDMEIGPGDRDGAEFVYAALPAVAIDDAFAGSGWKTTGLGRCALHIDASGKEAHGFVVHGKPGDPRDAAMRVVASARGALFVEVEDDRKVGPSARWIADDHLEIWMAKQMPSYMDHCLEPGEKPVQWGIRLADAKVFPGAGNPDPTALTVERAEAPAASYASRSPSPPSTRASRWSTATATTAESKSASSRRAASASTTHRPSAGSTPFPPTRSPASRTTESSSPRRNRWIPRASPKTPNPLHPCAAPPRAQPGNATPLGSTHPLRRGAGG